MDFTEVRPNGNTGYTWGGVAVSLDGQRMVASITQGGAGLYMSTDGGTNWANAISTIPFATVSMSDNGQIIFAGADGWSSLSTDGGANWTSLPDLGNCWVSDMTPNGKTIIVVRQSFGIMRSDDYGATWNSVSSPVYSGLALSISQNGKKILVVGSDDTSYGVYLSTDGGASWAQQMTSALTWKCGVMSKNGTVLLIGQNSGRLWLSTSGGTSWNEIQPIDNASHKWNVVAASDAGNVLFAGLYLTAETRTLYSSIDYGRTWVAERVLWPDYADPEPTWNCISCRATTKILCGTYGKRLWLSETLPLPPVVYSFPWVGHFQLSHVTSHVTA